MPQDVRELVVWQKAIDLTVRIYKLTRSFPKDELYGLVSQLRRAAVSVASNIAEGRGRLNQREFRQFLDVALGSIFEVKTQLVVARRLEIGKRSNDRRSDGPRRRGLKDAYVIDQQIGVEAES